MGVGIVNNAKRDEEYHSTQNCGVIVTNTGLPSMGSTCPHCILLVSRFFENIEKFKNIALWVVVVTINGILSVNILQNG